jgi:hypothetical protein
MTPALYQIACAPTPLPGLHEMALELLIDLADPVSFESLVELCCRPGLKNDPDDWRKAIWAITSIKFEGDAGRRRLKEALEAIERAGNCLQHEAGWTLQRLRERSAEPERAKTKP